MNTFPTIALLKKDFRLNRVPIFGGAALVLMPYLVGLIVLQTFTDEPAQLLPLGSHFPDRLGSKEAVEARRQRKIRDAFMSSPEMSLVLTGAMAAVFGGAAFAYERRERWADFLAMMPAPRLFSILSKSAVSLAFLLQIWTFNLLAAFWLIKVQSAFAHEHDLLILSIGPMLMLFGVAWLISSFVSSPSIAACASIGSFMTSGLMYSLLCAHSYSGHPSYGEEATYEAIGCGLCAIIGLLSFLGGSIYYLRRIEP